MLDIFLQLQVVEKAVEKGHEGINTILDIMHDCLPEPRTNKSNLPVTENLIVPITKRGKFVGPGGMNLKKILTETGVQISSSSEDATQFNLFAPNLDAMQEAKEFIQKFLEEERIPEFEFGGVYEVTVSDVNERGIFVLMHSELKPVFIPNSQLDATKVRA